MTSGCGPLLRFGRLRFCLGGPGNVPAYHEIFFQGDYRSLTIRPNDIALDAGANAGLFSIWAASRCRSVVSVEPAPETFDLLKLNKRINKATNVLLINKALSDHDGYVTMGGDGATYKIEQDGIRIPSTTIDSLKDCVCLAPTYSTLERSSSKPTRLKTVWSESSKNVDLGRPKSASEYLGQLLAFYSGSLILPAQSLPLTS